MNTSSVSEPVQNTNVTQPASDIRIDNETTMQNNNTIGNIATSELPNNIPANDSLALEEICNLAAQQANYCSGLPPF